MARADGLVTGGQRHQIVTKWCSGRVAVKPLAEHMAFYAAYHRDRRNQLTHFVGVPAIAFSILIPMAWVHVGPVSLALVFLLGTLVWYWRLDKTLAVTLAIVFLPAWAVAEAIARMSFVTGLTAFLVFFVGGWVVQLVGHAFEGRKPALVDNFLQVLVAPLFLAAEVYFALGLKQELKAEVERRVPQHLPAQASATSG
jgi:uncharacterized membrane protein YGL010W